MVLHLCLSEISNYVSEVLQRSGRFKVPRHSQQLPGGNVYANSLCFTGKMYITFQSPNSLKSELLGAPYLLLLLHCTKCSQ